MKLRGPIWALLLLSLLSPSSTEAAYTPAYWYRGENLILSLYLTSPEVVRISIEAVDARGRPTGRRETVERPSDKGANTIELSVGPEDGHRVQVDTERRQFHMWCQRGIWAAGPEGLELERRRSGLKLPYEFVAKGDVQLARGFSVSVLVNPEDRELVVERTLGRRNGHGIRPDQSNVLILVAKSNVGPVRVTLVERRGPRLQYFDTALVLDPEVRRFELSLRGFEARVPGERLETVHSVAIESVLPATAGSTISVSFLGLGRASLGPVSILRPDPENVQLQVGGPLGARAIVHGRMSGATEITSVRVNAQGRAQLPATAAEKLWISAELAPGVVVTDPPDAPHTYYARPSQKGEPLLVDDLDAPASVNAQRGFVTTFASSDAARRRTTMLRSMGALRLRFSPENGDEYSGLHSHLVVAPDDSHRSLELVLSGAGPTSAISVELTDRSHKTARIRLSSYLQAFGGEPQTVLIPLAAFDAAHRAYNPGKKRGRTTRLGFVLHGGPPDQVPRELELRRIRFVNEDSSLSIASFEGAQTNTNDLGHGQRAFAEGGRAKLEANFRAPGQRGVGARFEATSLTSGGYGIVHFGLGTLDARRYRELTLWVRGVERGSPVELVLHDGKRSARRPLGALIPAGTSSAEWHFAVVPLDGFPGVRMDRLERLQLHFESKTVDQARFELDELRLR